MIIGLIPLHFWGSVQLVSDQPETVTSTVVRIFVQYHHKLAYCVYTSHIKIKISEGIII